MDAAGLPLVMVMMGMLFPRSVRGHRGYLSAVPYAVPPNSRILSKTALSIPSAVLVHRISARAFSLPDTLPGSVQLPGLCQVCLVEQDQIRVLHLEGKQMPQGLQNFLPSLGVGQTDDYRVNVQRILQVSGGCCRERPFRWVP